MIGLTVKYKSKGEEIQVLVMDKIIELETKLEYVKDNSSRSQSQKVYCFASVTKYLVKNTDTNELDIISPKQIFEIV